MNDTKNTLTENYTKIPNSVARNPNITPHAKAIYLFIRSFSPSFPGYKRILKETGIGSKSTISKSLVELQNLKLIRVVDSPNHKSNLYEFPKTESVDSPRPPDVPVPVHKVDPNKTNIIITNNKASEASPALPVEDSLRKEIFAKAQSSLGPGARYGYKPKERPTFVIEASKKDI